MAANLIPEQIDAGEKLLGVLDDSGVLVDAAFWYLLEESGWRLFLHLPVCDAQGPLAAYKLIQSALGRLSTPWIRLPDTSAAEATDPYLQLLRTAVRFSGPHWMRFSDHAVGGHWVDDAVIYRMNGPAANDRKTVRVAPGAAKAKRTRVKTKSKRSS